LNKKNCRDSSVGPSKLILRSNNFLPLDFYLYTLIQNFTYLQWAQKV
jgi:hypothetical protein